MRHKASRRSSAISSMATVATSRHGKDKIQKEIKEMGSNHAFLLAGSGVQVPPKKRSRHQQKNPRGPGSYGILHISFKFTIHEKLITQAKFGLY